MSFFKRIGSFFKKLGFEKGDERSILIGFYSVRITWVFITIFLLIWTFYGVIATGRFGVQGIAFIASQLVYWSSYIYYKKKLGG